MEFFLGPATMAALGLVAAAGFFGHFPSVAKAVSRTQILACQRFALAAAIKMEKMADFYTPDLIVRTHTPEGALCVRLGR